MRQRIKEMEEEAQRLKEMQAQVEKELNLPNSGCIWINLGAPWLISASIPAIFCQPLRARMS